MVMPKKCHIGARYICVLISGLIENSIKIYIENYVQSRGNPKLASFIAESIKYETNMTCEKISKFLGKFDTAWSIAFEAHLTDERKDAVNSVIALRHQIAHGQHVGVTYSRIKRYFRTILSLIEDLEKVIAD
jgi:hypothetical protein